MPDFLLREHERWLYELDWLLFQDVPTGGDLTKRMQEQWVKDGFRLNLKLPDSIRADASRKKYGFRDMDAQAALSRLCRN